jgi:hypothetical protein
MVKTYSDKWSDDVLILRLTIGMIDKARDAFKEKKAN